MAISRTVSASGDVFYDVDGQIVFDWSALGQDAAAALAAGYQDINAWYADRFAAIQQSASQGLLSLVEGEMGVGEQPVSTTPPSDPIFLIDPGEVSQEEQPVTIQTITPISDPWFDPGGLFNPLPPPPQDPIFLLDPGEVGEFEQPVSRVTQQVTPPSDPVFLLDPGELTQEERPILPRAETGRGGLSGGTLALAAAAVVALALTQKRRGR